MKPNYILKKTLAAAGLFGLMGGTALADDFHDPVSVAWKFRFGQTSDGYSNAWNQYKGEGLLPIDIETDVIGNNTRYAGVWQENTDGRAWASWRNLTHEEFSERWQEYRDNGYRPIDQDAAVIGGQLRYSLIMVKNKEGIGWKSYRNLSSAQFSDFFQQNKNDFMPIDVDAVEYNGQMRYSIIWVENVENKSWILLRDMSPDFYGGKFQEYKGWARVADLDCYKRNGNLNYAAIWEENEPGRAWAAVREMSVQGLRNTWKKFHDQGMRVIDIEACPTSNGGVQYAAVFRENASRYDWGGRLAAQDALAEFVEDNEAPGVSAAIICKGKVVFRAGAGFADAEKNIKAHGGSIYRSASIAKSVTAVLGYDLQDDGIIDLDAETSSIVPGLESAHDHTVLECLQNAGAVGGYGDIPGNENADQTQYESALEVLTDKGDGIFLTNDAIIAGDTPGVDYTYSTIGYLYPSVAYEIEAGQDFDVLLKQRISDPLGLSTLRAETRTDPDSDGDLVKLYDKKAGGGYEPITETEFENTSWKWAGGGMQSSPVDLARLGDAVLGNMLFPEILRDEMWSGSTANSSYGAGWDLSSSSNPSQVSKRGRQQAALAHIRIDVNDEITVVAMTNGTYTKAEGSIITALTSDLLALAKEHCDPRVEPDRDRDELPDEWERQHAGGLDILSKRHDADHDGRSDYEEHRAGTNPMDSASNLRLWVTPNRKGIRVNWTCEATREYTLYSSKTLNGRDWKAMRDASSLPGSRSGEMGIDLPDLSEESTMFWRVEATRPTNLSTPTGAR